MNPIALFKTLVFAHVLVIFPALAQIHLAPQFTSSMILQRDSSNTLYGHSDTKQRLIAYLDGVEFADQQLGVGDWSIVLPSQDAGGPHTITLKTQQQTIVLSDVLFGDIWLASGQSNMELPMYRVGLRYKVELQNADYPQIRQLKINKHSAYQAPLKYVTGAKWSKAQHNDLAQFSAVGYFFAKELHLKTGVPIGIINNAYGGSRAQGWMSEAALKAFPGDFKIVQNNKNPEYIQAIVDEDNAKKQLWFNEVNQQDLGKKYQWQQPNYDDSHWRTMSVPGYWADQGAEDFNGVAWYRTQFELTAEQATQDGFLELGRIIDSDIAYVNGVEVGNVGYQYPPRRYTVAKHILKAGTNTLAVRIVAPSGKGGFIPDKPYRISFSDSQINLAGVWKFRFGHKMNPAPATQFWAHMQPNALYNAMLAPLKNTKVKGVIWYQGESNTSDPQQYAKVFPAMIENWRELFNQAELPFIFTQLANYMQADSDPSNAGWAQTRSAQATALKLHNTAMITAIDVGEWNDIHPLNKKALGDRFALAALNTVYGNKASVYQGPILSCASLNKQQQIELTLANPQNGLTFVGEKLDGFAVSNDGKNYQWATAVIKGDKIILAAPNTATTQFVRYAWQSNPERANLINNTGLPAYPAQLTLSSTCH